MERRGWARRAPCLQSRNVLLPLVKIEPALLRVGYETHPWFGARSGTPNEWDWSQDSHQRHSMRCASEASEPPLRGNIADY